MILILQHLFSVDYLAFNQMIYQIIIQYINLQTEDYFLLLSIYLSSSILDITST